MGSPSWLRGKSMKSKLKGTAGLTGAFVAGMVVATALFGWAAAGSKMPGERDPGQQVTVPSVISPTITDQDAVIYVRNWLEADGQAQALRVKYVPLVNQVLPGKKAATFFQLDRRLNMIIDLQLFSQIPLAKVKESSSQ